MGMYRTKGESEKLDGELVVIKLSSESRSRLTLLESYSITYVTENKRGHGRVLFAAVTKVVQLKGPITGEGRMLKSLLTCYCRKLGRNQDGGKPFTNYVF